MLKSSIVAASVLAAAGLILVIGTTAVGQDADGIRKIASLVKAGDMVIAKKEAAAYAKKHNDPEDLMTAFKDAKKKGLGVAGGDIGIEKTLNKVGRDAPTAANMAKMAAGYEQMGYDIAAVGLITEALAPAGNMVKKTRKDWLAWATGSVEAGLKVAEAAKKSSAADIKSAAAKVNSNCNSCHTTFR